MIKRMLWIAALMALVAIAGCGGKKAMNNSDTNAGTSTTENVPPTETPVSQPDPTPTEEVAPLSLNDAFFDFDSYSLSSEAKGTLEVNAKELKRVNAASIVIEGHCDERGTKAYNLALGEKRAGAAKDYLVALGVSGSRISTVSYGKERPFDTGHDESAWAKNRRAHFVVNK